MKFSLKFRRKNKAEDPENAVEETAATPARKEKKFSGAAVKRWLFLHGEKVATGVVVALLALMVYTAIGKLELDSNQTPDDLKSRASQIREKIDNATFPADSFPVPDFSRQVKQNSVKLAAESYQIRNFTGDEQGPCRRCDPEILPPQQLEIKAGHGLFFVAKNQVEEEESDESDKQLDAREFTPELTSQLGATAPPEGAQSMGKRWIAVNALVPYQQQVDAYDSCFLRCLGYDRQEDWPKYTHVNVRRIEMTPDAEEDWDEAKQWSVDENYLARLQDTWAGRGNDPVPQKYQVAGLIQPLGPLADGTWSGWASHSQFAESLPDDDSTQPRSDTTPAGMGPAWPGGSRPAVDPTRPPSGPNSMGMDTAGTPDTAEAAPATRPPLTKFKLIRVFDFDVEPGKSYRYQLQIVIKNPNGKSRGLPAFYLDNPEIKDEELRESEWSQSSGPAWVPLDANLYAAGIVPPTEDSPEPAAEVIVEILEIAKGTQPAGKMRLHRGEPLQGEAPLQYADVQSQKVMIDKQGKIDTEYTLLDLRLPQPTSVGPQSPAELLFMDDRGNLVLRNTVDNASRVERFKAIEKVASSQPTKVPDTPETPPADRDIDEWEDKKKRRR
ncbi:MAG: hypothetical protein GTO53_02355 [Planctomycetales bacterium]|nr:hypothetical protein [Planctomycetales bacterium]NIM08010.1 hypothetical protein [Planctomycetales bacterium]NIN07492.1 hypothetical protein [Planctomycetales bacterium]NIN76597.1 hypothetical protein [Planctomycetales bacterium]NIO33787.1 hypothetical protein [Planctomycetales bacterium]